jgi:hypothetical protein
MPSFTFIDEPAGLDLGEWLAHRTDVLNRLKSKPEDEGLKIALEIAEWTIASMSAGGRTFTLVIPQHDHTLAGYNREVERLRALARENPEDDGYKLALEGTEAR